MMKINGVEVEDTYAEAFKMWGSRLIITAINQKWVETVANIFSGFGTSIIACNAEVGIDRFLPSSDTPDGRPGVAVIAFARNKKSLGAALLDRIGQCVLPCPTTALFDGTPEPDATYNIGSKLKFFGDGYQYRKRVIYDRPFYRIPVMEGEFCIEQNIGMKKGVAGGNILILGESIEATLKAAEDSVEAVHKIDYTITPFPGGVCRSGSKVGSQYKFLRASTNTAFCPTIRGIAPDTQLPSGVNSVLEIIINGLNFDVVKEGVKASIDAATKVPGVIRISAGNYGGKLGKFLIHFKELYQ